MSDPDEEGATWLTRLSAEEWLVAARGELTRSVTALKLKQQRAGVTQARRAAGMAWNAVLHGIVDSDERARYGRSYMDHLRVLSEDLNVTAQVREAAKALTAAPLEPVLVQLGSGDTRVSDAAGVIVGEATRRLANVNAS